MIVQTRLCDLLGIEHPILNAPMALVAGAQLAAAVSASGGFGLIGGAFRGPEDLRSEIRAARALTDRPLGVWPDGIAMRTLRNRFTDEWHGREDEIRAWSQEMSDEYRTRDMFSRERGIAPAGECVGVVHAVEPAGDIVRCLVAETEEILARRSSAFVPHR